MLRSTCVPSRHRADHGSVYKSETATNTSKPRLELGTLWIWLSSVLGKRIFSGEISDEAHVFSRISKRVSTYLPAVFSPSSTACTPLSGLSNYLVKISPLSIDGCDWPLNCCCDKNRSTCVGVELLLSNLFAHTSRYISESCTRRFAN